MLPVISTDTTEGLYVIENGIDGLVIRAWDRETLAQSMTLLFSDPSLCLDIWARAREKALSYSWEAYGDRWKAILDGEVGDKAESKKSNQ